MKKFRSTHNLKLVNRPYTGQGALPGYEEFKLGTISGVWWFNTLTLDIMGISNSEPGNGHMEDAFEWLENICKEGKVPLRFCLITNETFFNSLLERGFVATKRPAEVIKFFK